MREMANGAISDEPVHRGCQNRTDRIPQFRLLAMSPGWDGTTWSRLEEAKRSIPYPRHEIEVGPGEQDEDHREKPSHLRHTYDQQVKRT
jgi:hypothetical protein